MNWSKIRWIICTIGGFYVPSRAKNKSVVYFDQLLGAARTQKLVKTFFSALISAVKSLKKVWNESKRLKTAEKSVLTSLQGRTAPESWSKYTTSGDHQCSPSIYQMLPDKTKHQYLMIKNLKHCFNFYTFTKIL